MLAVLAAVLALAGAPANTQVVCDPALTVAGQTHYLRTPPLIELQVTACSSLLIAGATPGEREKIRRLNPGVNLDQRVGVGLLIVLHEAFHAALRSADETLVECAAMAHIQSLLAEIAASPVAEMVWARIYDASLPPSYHQGCPS